MCRSRRLRGDRRIFIAGKGRCIACSPLPLFRDFFSTSGVERLWGGFLLPVWGLDGGCKGGRGAKSKGLDSWVARGGLWSVEKCKMRCGRVPFSAELFRGVKCAAPSRGRGDLRALCFVFLRTVFPSLVGNEGSYPIALRFQHSFTTKRARALPHSLTLPNISAGLNGWGGLGGNMPSLNDLLLSASAGGNVLDVEALLSKGTTVCTPRFVIRLLTPLTGADAFYQRTSDGVSSLMLAAKGGHAKVVDMLLLAGAPWNALDRSGKCAGEYALAAGNQNLVDVLVNAGVRAELLLRTLERTLKEQRAKAVNDEEAAKKVVEKKCAVNGNPKDCPSANSDLYLTRNVRYENGKLMDSENDAVMMEWEKPLMVAHAQVLCVNANAATQESSGSATTESSSAASSGGESAAAADLFMNAVKPLNVLNVGYGMGIFDRAVQEWKPTTHTIIEAHPQVYARMIEEGWNKKVRTIRRGGEGMHYFSLSFVRIKLPSRHDSPRISRHARLPHTSSCHAGGCHRALWPLARRHSQASSQALRRHFLRHIWRVLRRHATLSQLSPPATFRERTVFFL